MEMVSLLITPHNALPCVFACTRNVVIYLLDDTLTSPYIYTALRCAHAERDVRRENTTKVSVQTQLRAVSPQATRHKRLCALLFLSFIVAGGWKM